MKVLFLHQNFPAQFRQLVEALAQDPNNELMAFKQPPERQYPGVAIVAYRFLSEPDPTIHPLLREMEAKMLRGEAVAEAARRLHTLGWNPDVIVAHPGWGEALFVKDVWPNARLIVYAEYYYRAEGQDFNFDPEYPDEDPQTLHRLKLKNSVMLQAIAEADDIWCPTEWQKSTFPDWIQGRIKVIHEGIDTDVFKPDPKVEFQIGNKGIDLKRGDEIITYAARSLEPVRGFHIFMRAIPEILRKRPKAHIIIMGAEPPAYGRPPADAPSWLKKMLAEVGDQLDPARVHFVGFLPPEAYRAVLQISTVHVYLTYPFLLSWSLLEAMACGAFIVGSDTAPVREVITDGKNGHLAPFFSPDKLAQTVIKHLKAKPLDRAAIAKQARDLVCNAFDMNRCTQDMLASLQGPPAPAQPKPSAPRKTKAAAKASPAPVAEQTPAAPVPAQKATPAKKSAKPKKATQPAAAQPQPMPKRTRGVTP